LRWASPQQPQQPDLDELSDVSLDFLPMGTLACSSVISCRRSAHRGITVIFSWPSAPRTARFLTHGGRASRVALLPLSIGALVSGVVQSLGTRRGLFRHYWVLVKLALTLFAVAALFVHQATAISDAAGLAASAGAPLIHADRLHQLGIQLTADSSLALALLLTTTLIAVYKPWGLVGQVTRGLRVFGAAVMALIVAFIALHLSGHSQHRHSH